MIGLFGLRRGPIRGRFAIERAQFDEQDGCDPEADGDEYLRARAHPFEGGCPDLVDQQQIQPAHQPEQVGDVGAGLGLGLLAAA